MWHPLLSPFRVATALLGLQLASIGLAPAPCPGPLPTEGQTAGGHSHPAPTAPPARPGGHGIATNLSGFGDLPPAGGEVEGGPVAAFATEENVRLREKTCQAGQGNAILLDERCFWKDTVWSFGHRGCRRLASHLGLLSCGLIPALCKAVSVLVTTIAGIRLLARCWKSHRGQRESAGGRSKSPHGVDCPECAICLQACEPGRPLKLLSCSHIYHGKCIDRWHRAQPGSKTCPLCLYGVTAVVLTHPRARNERE